MGALKFGPAIFSKCEKYRYVLEREWETKWDNWLAEMYTPEQAKGFDSWRKLKEQRVMFLMLNPSTADSEKLDPTCTRCRNYAMEWGYGGFFVCNLFGYRATKPKDMRSQADPVGVDNDMWIKRVCDASDLIICAWGMHGSLHNRDDKVIQYLPREKTYCLKVAKDGVTPVHPLYQAKNLLPLKWPECN